MPIIESLWTAMLSERSSGLPRAATDGRGLECDVLVLDAWLRQSLVAVRSLGRQGLRVAALAAENNIPTFSSRWCRQQFVAPQGTDDPLAYIESALNVAKPRVVITSSDATIALLRRHRSRLEKRVRVALAEEPALGAAINKEETLSIAASLGIRVPRGVVVGSVEDLAPALRDIGLPAVLKPVESWVWESKGGRRLACRLVTTPEEASVAVGDLTSHGGRAYLQQLLSGRREAVSVLFEGGKIYARFAQWAKRTQPPLGGTSVLRQSIAVPQDIGEQSECLIRALNLEGYSEVEFRRDAAGFPYLMEINPRLSASVELAVRAGVDFPKLLYQWASGGPIDQVKGYQVGKWMRYLKGDLDATLQTVAQRGRPGVTPPVRAILEFCFSFLRPMGYDYLDWQDPRPAFTAALGFLHSLRKSA